MKKNKFNVQGQEEDVDYWRSMVDVIIALLLIVLMVMSLLLLGLMDTPDGEGDVTEIEPTPTVSPTPSPTPSIAPTPSPTPDYDVWSGGGGGRGYTPVPTATPAPTSFFSEYDKSAVRVVVCDADTGLQIRQAGMTFDLLSGTYENLSLKVYYPKVQTYTLFETLQDGAFYLPEKLVPGTYVLRSVSVPDSYDLPADVTFELEKDYDWSSPYVVEVSLAPYRSAIRLAVTDESTGKGLSGVSFRVVATEDVITADGTLRYSAGQTVETLVTDKDGRAESSPLYLGEFELRLSDIPFGYAGLQEAPTVAQSRGSTPEVDVALSRTTMKITVRDGSTFARLSGVPFLITGNSGTVQAETDADGVITLADLDKSTVYTYRQAAAYGDYTLDDTVYSFTVDALGLIDGEATGSVTINQHVILCSFDMTGYVSGSAGVGHHMALKNAAGATVREWDTEASPVTVSGISPGTYTLAADGQNVREITVELTSGVQSFTVRAWQLMDAVILGGGVLLGLGVLTALIMLLRRRRK